MADHERSLENRKPLSLSQQRLAEQYLPLARSLAKPMKAAWPSLWDEFESAAMLALVEAAESFDPLRKVRFATYARIRILGALRDSLRRLTTLSGWRVEEADGTPPPSLCSLQTDAELRGKVITAEPDDPVGKDLEDQESAEAWLRKLPPKHARACRLLYLEGKTQMEAARVMGCSQSRLSAMHREAMRMLKACN